MGSEGLASARNQTTSRRLLGETIGLLRPFWPCVVFATGIGIAGGIATAWLLAGFNRELHSDAGVDAKLAGTFLGLCILSVAGTAVAGATNSIVGQKIIAALRKDISARILRASIAKLEVLRSYRLMSVLTGDVDTISAFTFNFSSYAIAFAIVIGSLCYLLSLSLLVFLLAIASLALGLVINMFSHKIWIHDYEAVRTTQDELHKQYRAIIDGAKELKISRPLRARVHGTLLSTASDRIASLKSRAMRLHWIADAGASAIFFLMIGLLLAGRSCLGIDSAVISGAVIVLLYIKGPVEQLAGALPVFDQARISFARIAALSAELDNHEINFPLGLPSDQNPRQTVSSIGMRGVTYDFPAREGHQPFGLGPIDLTINGGELIFIVGDNGSGKTTLIKLLLGLYSPKSGSIQLDGKAVTAEDRDGYRQLFTTIFSDYYLFDDLAYGALTDAAGPYLEQLGIAHKVKMDGGRFTTTDLSTGQRKRLALVQAWLEDRPIVVTDEWAADQDPEFRRIFYEELLPQMKRQGKTLIVISHDDRYFHVADRIITMRDGRIHEAASVFVEEPPATIGLDDERMDDKSA